MGLGLARVQAYYFLYDYFMWHYLLDYLLYDYLYLLLDDYLLLDYYLAIDIDYLFYWCFLLYYFFDYFFILEDYLGWDFERKEDFFDDYHFLLYLNWNLYDYFFLRVCLYGILAILHSLGN